MLLLTKKNSDAALIKPTRYKDLGQGNIIFYYVGEDEKEDFIAIGDVYIFLDFRLQFMNFSEQEIFFMYELSMNMSQQQHTPWPLISSTLSPAEILIQIERDIVSDVKSFFGSAETVKNQLRQSYALEWNTLDPKDTLDVTTVRVSTTVQRKEPPMSSQGGGAGSGGGGAELMLLPFPNRPACELATSLDPTSENAMRCLREGGGGTPRMFDNIGPPPLGFVDFPPEKQRLDSQISQLTFTPDLQDEYGKSLPNGRLYKIQIKNTGSTDWPPSTRLIKYLGNDFGGPLSGVEVKKRYEGVKVGESVIVELPLRNVQRAGGKEGFFSDWILYIPQEDKIFGEYVSIKL